jgi:hypothetical protein
MGMRNHKSTKERNADAIGQLARIAESTMISAERIFLALNSEP